MEFNRWKFSKEVKPELKEFLELVQKYNKLDKQSAEEYNRQKLWQQVLPQVSINDLYIEDPLNINSNSDDIIIIDEADDVEIDDFNSEKQNDYIPDVSIINLTLVESAEITLNPNIQDFVNYLSEYFESDESLLQTEYMRKLSSDFDLNSLKELFRILSNSTPNQSLLNLGQSICTHYSASSIIVARQYCQCILLNKLITSEPSEMLISLLRKFAKVYPDITCEELLLPLLNVDYKCVNIYLIIVDVLPENEKQKLLRDFLFSSSQLDVYQLPMLQPLICLTDEDTLKRRIINLMFVSENKFSDDKVFIKILISFIQSLGSGFMDQEQLLYEIIEKNKTIFKISARMALNEWSDKYNQ